MVEWLGLSSKDHSIPGSSPGAARLVHQRPSGVWITCDSCTKQIMQKEQINHAKREG
jgi:hypothetical protein